MNSCDFWPIWHGLEIVPVLESVMIKDLSYTLDVKYGIPQGFIPGQSCPATGPSYLPAWNLVLHTRLLVFGPVSELQQLVTPAENTVKEWIKNY